MRVVTFPCSCGPWCCYPLQCSNGSWIPWEMRSQHWRQHPAEWVGYLAVSTWHFCWGVGTWLWIGFQAEFVVLALTFGPNSNLFGISGRTLHVLQLILDRAQQSWNSLSVWETPSLLWGCCLIIWEELEQLPLGRAWAALKWGLETLARVTLVSGSPCRNWRLSAF